MAVEFYDFGPYKIHHTSVFHTTDLSFAFVNLRPAVTGIYILLHHLFHLTPPFFFHDFISLYITFFSFSGHILFNVYILRKILL